MGRNLCASHVDNDQITYCVLRHDILYFEALFGDGDLVVNRLV